MAIPFGDNEPLENIEDAAEKGEEYLFSSGIKDSNMPDDLYCDGCDTIYYEALELCRDIKNLKYYGISNAGMRCIRDYLAENIHNISSKKVKVLERTANPATIDACLRHSAMRFSKLEKALSEIDMKWVPCQTGDNKIYDSLIDERQI
jgi:hypothetical protein